jgi:hypothetical protein
LISFEPGRIESVLVSMSDPEGDPAAFAVSWAKLFDDAVLAPPGVVELGERREAGKEAIVAPKFEAKGRGSSAWETWLAVAAAGATLIAAGLARSGRMG